jgi:hypothetical protein
MGSKKIKCNPAKAHPEVMDIFTDIAILKSKWTNAKMAETMGMTRQGFELNVKKKEKNEKR